MNEKKGYSEQLAKDQKRWGCKECYYEGGDYGFPMCHYPLRIDFNYEKNECKTFKKKQMPNKEQETF